MLGFASNAAGDRKHTLTHFDILERDRQYFHITEAVEEKEASPEVSSNLEGKLAVLLSVYGDLRAETGKAFDVVACR
jgi:hypothetical protein